jgi:hypothetical protein
MRDLTKRGMTAVSPRLPKGLAFEITDLVLIRRWADCHDFRMLVRLDHGASVDEEYEEVIAFQTEISPLYRLIMWRNAPTVFVRPLVGRGKQDGSVADALKSLVPKPRCLLKSNTSKTRTHSLFRQGCMLYDLIPNMPDHRLSPLIQKFNEAVSNAELFTPEIALMK